MYRHLAEGDVREASARCGPRQGLRRADDDGVVDRRQGLTACKVFDRRRGHRSSAPRPVSRDRSHPGDAAWTGVDDRCLASTPRRPLLLAASRSPAARLRDAAPARHASPSPRRQARTSLPPAAHRAVRRRDQAQTDTDWGRIWDSLPSTFPTVAGSAPASETADRTGIGGPGRRRARREGGRHVLETQLSRRLHDRRPVGTARGRRLRLDMTGAATGCKVRVSTAPTGGLTTLTILYGAGCPHD